MNDVKQVIIPIAGLGTRLLPGTKAIPKEMVYVYDRPLIQYAIDEALRSNIEEFIFVTPPNRDILEKYLTPDLELEKILDKKADLLRELRSTTLNAKITYVEQSRPLGLGHAIGCAKKYADEQFAVILPDDVIVSKDILNLQPPLARMIEGYKKFDTNIISFTHLNNKAQFTQHGMLSFKDDSNLCDMYGFNENISDIVEKPTESFPSEFGIVGRYIFKKNIFDALDVQFWLNPTGQEISLTDAIKEYPITGFDVGKHGIRYDCGSKPGIVQTIIEFDSRTGSLFNITVDNPR